MFKPGQEIFIKIKNANNRCFIEIQQCLIALKQDTNAQFWTQYTPWSSLRYNVTGVNTVGMAELASTALQITTCGAVTSENV